MKNLLLGVMMTMVLSGCGQYTATEKVVNFIKTKDIRLLSKTKTSQCSEKFVKNFHYFDENALPTTNKYYELSKYLYDNVRFEPVSEKEDGDATEVTVKVSMPKPIDDAKSFIFAEENSTSNKEKEALDNLLALYKGGKLKNMEFTTFDMRWRVLPDGIDPDYTPEQIKICSE